MQNNHGKRSGGSRLGDFLAGKGFYIVLFLCVAAIGVSGYFLLTDSGTPGEMTVAAPTQVVVTPPPAAVPSPVAPTPATPKPTPKPTPAPTQTPAPTPTPTPAPAVYTWPVKGELVGDYSLEVLAYDETMGDWRTHSGIDIAATLGTQVMAVSDGTVTQVYFDPLMGETVAIQHEGDIVSTYANLGSVPTVEVGDPVTTGMVIGAVGDTAIAEGAKTTHLHFEMTEAGAPVDPVNYLPELP